MLKMLTPVGRDPKIADGISAFVSSTRRESRSFAPIDIDSACCMQQFLTEVFELSTRKSAKTDTHGNSFRARHVTLHPPPHIRSSRWALGSGILNSMSHPSIQAGVALDAIALTRRLIDIESITYNECVVGEFLVEFLTARGFHVETTAVEQDRESRCQGKRLNVYAGAAGRTPDVVFSTHMDTVPPFIPSSEDDEFIHGRGACDAKGIIAAQIAAAERLREESVNVGLLFVVGEERDSAGAKVANQNPRGSRFLINGEPTDNRVALASKGALRAEIRATGRMAHSAYPELGESATHKLIEALSRVLALPLPSTPGIGPSTLNVGTIAGGRATNVIADHAEAHLLIRLVGPSEPTRKAIEEVIMGLATVDFTLEIPFMRFRDLEGLPSMVAAFTTDAPWLTEWGEPLLLGPGSIHVAHTPHEKLAKRELVEAIDLYTDIARRLVSGEA